MSYYHCTLSACNAAFTKADRTIADLTATHQDVSQAIDDARAVFTDPKVAAISTALATVYNKCLTRAMTDAEAHAEHGVSAGRTAVGAIVRSQQQSVDDTERTANSIPEPTIRDGKK